MNTHSPSNGAASRIPEVKFRAYWRVIWSHKWIALLGFLSMVGATGLYLWKTEPVYEARVMLIRSQTAQTEESLVGQGGVSTAVSSVSALNAILKSGLVTVEVSRQMGFLGIPLSPIDARQRLSLNLVPESSMLYLIASGKGPLEAMRLANVAADALIKALSDLKGSRLTEAERFLDSQMKDVGLKLRQAEEALSSFREEENIIGSNEKGTSTGLLNQLSELYAELIQTQNNREVVQAKLDRVRQLLDKKQREITAPDTNKITSKITHLQAMLVSWEIELGLLKQQYSYTTPTIRDLDKKIEAAQAQLNGLFQTLREQGMSMDPLSEWQGLTQEAVQLEIQLRGLEQSETLVQSRIDRFKEMHPGLIGKEVEFAALQRAARIHEHTYLLLIDKLEALKFQREMRAKELTVIEPAPEPEKPVKPNKRLVLTLGVLLGVIAGVGAAFFLEAADDSVKAEEDVEKLLGVPVVGVIPTIKVEKQVLKAITTEEREDGTKNRRAKKETKVLMQLRGRMINHVDSRSFFTESYRLLRTNLQLDDEAESHVILISGARQGDGKTLTVANLGIAMARVGLKTLAIDADLRNPKLHALFGQPRNPGLSEVLVAGNGAKPVGQQETGNGHETNSEGTSLVASDYIRKTAVDNFYLLPSGTAPESPAELLGSRKMRRLIKVLRSKFEVILIDSPPILPVTDATVLAAEAVDGVLLVVKSGETKREMAQRGQELLQKVNANVLGVVLNGIDYKKYYGSHYSYYYNGQSSKDEAA